MKFSTLFKKTSTGALQFWEVSTDASTIVTRWGQIDGKIQETRDLIKEGKNAGRSNATTAEQQAEAEAQSLWEKKLKAKGYVQSLEAAEAGESDALVEGGILPMLAHSFAKSGEKIVYPAYVQPKFDGHRCIAIVSDGQATLWSRTRKQITGLPHIVKALEAKFKNVVLDGELYHHDYRENFEALTSFIRTPEAKEGHEIVQYHIYDCTTYDSLKNDAPFSSRHGLLRTAFTIPMPVCLQAVETIEVADEDEMMLAFERFLKEGYEGLMVRNRDGKYVGKRSYDLQKVKEFQDAEFQIVGVEAGRGKMADKAIFVCVTDAGVQFRVKMKGSLESLKQYVEDPSLAVDKHLTVQYQGITKASGVPRFPVGLRIREDV